MSRDLTYLLLTLLAAVLGTAATSALGKLPRVLLPLSTLVVGALSDATPRVVFPAQVAHHHARPVLHVRGVVADRELLNQREDVVVVRELVFLQLLLVLDRYLRQAQPPVSEGVLQDVGWQQHLQGVFFGLVQKR